MITRFVTLHPFIKISDDKEIDLLLTDVTEDGNNDALSVSINDLKGTQLDIQCNATTIVEVHDNCY